MSWEEFNNEKSCPCSKGTYTITRQENDWGKGHISFRMNCKDCRNSYVHFAFPYHDAGAPGGTSLSDLWVLKEDKKALDDIEKQIRRMKEAILALAQGRYLKQWLARFLDKPKNAVWAELKSIDRAHVPSIGTFYNHTKNETPEDYLRTWFDAEKVIPILAYLGIQDSEIVAAYAELSEKNERRENAEGRMLRRGVHI
jgi:hypothetical protein